MVESGFLSEDNKDISVYDLSIDGAREFNSKGPMAYSDTYYFSFATERTHPDQDCILFIFCGKWEEDPDFGMSLFLKPTGNLIGQNGAQEVRKNDGLVNWLHMLCPTVDGAERSSCVEYDGTWNVGTWSYFDVDFLDHVQISVRNEANAEAASQLYRDHAARLSALP